MIVIKSIIVLGSNLSDAKTAWLNFMSFILLYLMQFLSQAYWLEGANRTVNGMFLSLVVGAFLRVLEVEGETPPSYKGWSLDWAIMLSGVLLGWYMDFEALDTLRLGFNAYLTETFNSFDLADNPALIHRLGLAELLHSPPRQGGYAHYLALKHPKEIDEIEVRRVPYPYSSFPNPPIPLMS